MQIAKFGQIFHEIRSFYPMFRGKRYENYDETVCEKQGFRFHKIHSLMETSKMKSERKNYEGKNGGRKAKRRTHRLH